MFYGGILNYFPDDPLNDNRDRLIVSKGHGSICLYPILADLGFFDKKELDRVCQKGGILGGIPDPIIPGYETVNGSLGHGLGVAAGIALGQKRRGHNNNVFVLTGDGELHEGSTWATIMLAPTYVDSNLVVFIDFNGLQSYDKVKDVISYDKLDKILEHFGWKVIKIRDGHSFKELLRLKKTININYKKPLCIKCKTIKGKGVHKMENDNLWHYKPPNKTEYSHFLKEIKNA